MAKEELAYTITNRVANSKLKTFNLEDYYPNGERYVLDISQWLLEGLVLQEGKFREQAKNHEWSQYKDGYLCLYCSTDAIIPSWAYMLLETYALEYTRKTVVGSIDTLDTILLSQILQGLDLEDYRDAPVIIKGCSNKPIPQNTYLEAINILKPIAKSIMFGEACSSVPLYKRR